MVFLISIFWFIRTTKAILFWFYLWQLKEYHTGRFLDHFRTSKGKQFLFNKLIYLKLVLLLALSFLILLTPKESYGQFGVIVLLVLYLLESAKGGQDFLQRKLKKPVLTKKTALLISAGLLVGLLVLFILLTNVTKQGLVTLYFWLLAFDIVTPVIASAIVLIFQPLAVLGRNQIIKKAKKKRAEYKDLLVIGITGSYGKTSTKEFLATILSEKFKVLKTKEHQNSEVGISQCILNDLRFDHEIFICEMGAYNRRGIKLLCDIAKPKIGILTGINEQHMATFGSQDNIIKTKFELIESLPDDGVGVLNWDNEFIKSKVKSQKSKAQVKSQKLYSIKEKLDIWAESIKTEKGFVSFKVFSRDGDSAEFDVNLMGGHNVINILGAAAAAKELGMTLGEIARACKKIEPWQGGMQLKTGINGLNIIDATYSANPDGVISHLEYLKTWSQKKTIVMPCLIELGKASKEVHKKIGQKIGEVCDLAIITTKERFKEIKDGSTSSPQEGERVEVIFLENPKEIFEKIKVFCKSDDVVLLESRVPVRLISLLIKNNGSL